jgi:hypothetical protein
MKRILRQNIRGISFHSRRSGVGKTPAPQALLRGHSPLLSDPETMARLAEGSDAPPPLDRRDIGRLLGDFGRQELHTLVSDAIDAAVRWKQLCDALERSLGPMGSPILGDEERILSTRIVEAFLGARRTLQLWKHRIEILEMIADAQRSLLTAGRKARR